MSGLAALGGIGHGLMQGSNFVQNKRQQDARLGMLQEEQGWKRDDRQAAEDDRQRKAQFDQIYTDTWNELGVDADPLAVSSEVFKRSVATGQARREELEPLLAGVKQMRQRGITNAIRMGDGESLASAFSQQFGRPVQVQTQMTKDALGHPMPMFSIVGEDGSVLQQLDALQVGSILGADDILADEERKMNRAKGLSALAKDQASIRSSDASAANSYSSARERGDNVAWQRELRDAQRAVARGDATPEQAALLQQQARSAQERDPYMTNAAKEQEMYARLSPEQQQQYRARRAEEIRNDLRKSNATEFMGRQGAERLEAEVQRQTDAMLGAGASAGGGRTYGSPAEVQAAVARGELKPGGTFRTSDGQLMMVPAQ